MTFFIFLTGPHTFIAYTSWNNQQKLVILDAIKASVPKFLNFLGAELDKNWITHLEGKTLLLAENTDLNQISKKFIHLSKIRFKIIAWIMQKNDIFAQKKILNHLTVILQPFIQKFFINFFLFKVSLKNYALNRRINMKWQKDLVKKI